MVTKLIEIIEQERIKEATNIVKTFDAYNADTKYNLTKQYTEFIAEDLRI
ncbi:MAG: hypothetical protein WC781_02665 [Candidatus Pacearchaeota archaeon]|jgi:hypothetical protein